jgi:hypothetical protein
MAAAPGDNQAIAMAHLTLDDEALTHPRPPAAA